MAAVFGRLLEAPRRTLLQGLAARLSETARLQAEHEEGAGLRRLLDLLGGLPEPAAVAVRPALGFMSVDCILAVPGRMLVVNALHWPGALTLSEDGQWAGPGGKVKLGRPDRRSRTFCDRLEHSGQADGMALEPVVVFTAGPVTVAGAAEATLVQWDAAAACFAGAVAAAAGPDPRPLARRLAGG